jgi:hypothetical protein
MGNAGMKALGKKGDLSLKSTDDECKPTID